MGNYGHTVRSDTAVLPDFKHTGQPYELGCPGMNDCFFVRSVNRTAQAHADKVRIEVLGS